MSIFDELRTHEQRAAGHAPPIHCARCGRFVRVISTGQTSSLDGPEWWVRYECTVHGEREDWL